MIKTRHETRDSRLKTQDSRLRARYPLNSYPTFYTLLALCSMLLVLHFIPCLLSAEVTDFALKWIDMPVASVEYKCDGEFSESRIREVTVIKAGSTYSRSKVRESIENIYSLGGFSDIQVDARQVEKGVILTFILTKQMTIRNINLLGSKEISSDEIINVIRSKKGHEYSDSVAKMDVESMVKLYRSLGFFNASISFSADVDYNSKIADVTFKISEGEQPVVIDVVLLGTNEDVIRTADDLQKAMEIKLGEGFKGQRALDSDAKSIENTYRKNGYITAKVEKAYAVWEPDIIEQYSNRGRHFPLKDVPDSVIQKGVVTIVIEMEQGRKVIIKVIEDGKEVEVKNIRETITARKLGSLSESALRRSSEDIADFYRLRGYYSVEVAQPIVLKDQIWNFDIDENTEGWEPYDEFTSLEVSDRSMKLSAPGKMPRIQSPVVDIDTDIYQKIQIRMRTDKGSMGRLYWADKPGKWSEKKRFEFKLIPGSQFHDYSINISGKAKLRQIRIDPVDLPGADVEIASIGAVTVYVPVIFEVKKNRKMLIKDDISIVNSQSKGTQLKAEDIRKQMLTRKKSPFAFWPFSRYLPNGIFDRVIFQTDLRAIVAFYKDKGYLSAQIQDVKEQPEPKKGKIKITILISEGKKTVISDVVLVGNNPEILSNEEALSNLAVIQDFKAERITVENSDPPGVRYLADSPKEFREDDIVADRSYLRAQYADKGYLAQIEPVKQFKDNDTKVIITYYIVPGKQIRVQDEIEIVGNSRTKRGVIERELSDNLTKKKILSYGEVAKSWQRMYDLGLFEGVRFDTQPVAGFDDLYKMTVSVTERNAISVNARVGFSSSEDFRGGIEFKHINLWGTGRRVNAKATIGTEGTRGEIRYTEPRILTRLLGSRSRGLSGLADLHRYSEKRYEQTWTGGRLGISQTFRRINIFTANYRYDVVEYKTDTARIGRIETNFQRDGRDNPLNPRSGWFHNTTLEYANTHLGGTETFTKFSMDNTRYNQLPLGFVLALGISVGYAWGLGNTGHVLTPEQFNLIDFQTPRGYKWEIEDAGNVMFNTSAELRFPIYKWVRGAVFFDSAYLGNKLSDFDLRIMKSSVGGGLRFITPIGPLRLDYGYPVRGDGKRNYWPHVAFGHAF